MSNAQSSWPTCKFGDIAEFRNGLNFTQASRGQAVKVVGVGDFGVAEELRDFSATTVVTIDGDLGAEDLLQDGDLLFVRSNGNKALVGRCVYVQPNGERITFSGFTIRARITSNEVDRWFISKVVRSPLFKESLYRLGGGSSINNLNQGVLSQFEFPLPPLPEQKEIAQVLRTWDDAIDTYEREREIKGRALKAARQKIFGLDGSPLQKWKAEKLSEISDRVRRNAESDNHPVMTISGKHGFLRQDEKFDRFMAGNSVDNYLLLHRGEFAYNKGNSKTYPQGCIYRLEQDTALVPFVYFAFALRSHLNSDFYRHLFESGFLNHQLSRLINSGVRNDGLLNLAAHDFFACKVPVPPRSEQDRVAAFFNLAKEELSHLDRQLDALVRQKRGLMQKLLTGEWRVPSKAKGAA